MKTLKTLAILFCAAVLTTACGNSADSAESVEKLIEKYEQACKDCNPIQAKEIAEQFDVANLTPEQSVRIIKASNLGAQLAGDQFKEVANKMPYNYWDIVLNQYEERINEYAAVLKQKKAGKKVDKQLDRLDDKIDNLKDKLDDAKLTKKQKARFKKLADYYDDIED